MMHLSISKDVELELWVMKLQILLNMEPTHTQDPERLPMPPEVDEALYMTMGSHWKKRLSRHCSQQKTNSPGRKATGT